MKKGIVMRSGRTLIGLLALQLACSGTGLPPSEGDAAESLAAVATTTHTISVIDATMGDIADSAAQTVRIQRDLFSGTATRTTGCINGEGGSTATTAYAGDKTSGTAFNHSFEMTLTFSDCLADEANHMVLTASAEPLTITGTDDRRIADGEILNYEAHGVVNYTSDEGNGSCGVAYTYSRQDNPGAGPSTVRFTGKVCGIKFTEAGQLRTAGLPHHTPQ